jgi:hypothetical protein
MWLESGSQVALPIDDVGPDDDRAAVVAALHALGVDFLHQRIAGRVCCAWCALPSFGCPSAGASNSGISAFRVMSMARMVRFFASVWIDMAGASGDSTCTGQSIGSPAKV